MADEAAKGEDELENRQGPQLYPIGRALRTTYDAENHDSLGNDLTGLMLALARVEPPFVPAPPPPPLALRPVAAVRPRSLLQRVIGRLRSTA